MEQINIKTRHFDCDENQIRQELLDSKIDFSDWGVGSAKSFDHLLQEIVSGESSFEVTNSGEVIRKIEVASAIVWYRSVDGDTYLLSEDRQVFKDGRERKRKLPSSISEKIQPDESPDKAIIRGIQEELGIKDEVDLDWDSTTDDVRESESYPGLKTSYLTYYYEVKLNDQQFNPQGYIEYQDDKTTYFVWDLIKN